MRIHLIAIGGKVMHNLALELLNQGHIVTGSDDEIYDPAYSRLKKAGILPDKMGWDPARITQDIDTIILGMHAQADNPELLRAQALNMKVVSFPEYIGEGIKGKNRIVVCGSHGKSTITAMIMHALKHEKVDSDYALGGMLDGFDRMVSLTNAPVAVIEGDEYLSSRIDPTSKMIHYHGDTIIITGIEWDHMNVFPTLDIYIEQFNRLIDQSKAENAQVIWYADDPILNDLIKDKEGLGATSYKALKTTDEQTVMWEGKGYKLHVFGDHNMANMNAARIACASVGISAHEFFQSMESFRGVGKRLQKINDTPIVYLDYAHAPSKVKATVAAVRKQFSSFKVLAVYELHTYSSLSAEFLPNYYGSLTEADTSVIYFDNHALEIKRLPELDNQAVRSAFGNETEIFNNTNALETFLKRRKNDFDVILLMSSGTFGGLDLDSLFADS